MSILAPLWGVIDRFIQLTDWEWIHVKIGTKKGSNEMFFQNPNKPDVVEEPVQTQVEEPQAPVEKLEDKINRFRKAQPGELTPTEELWWKERQKELEDRKIGQIQPDDSEEVALSKLKQIGVE